MRISVIMATYNGAVYIDQQIRSIVSQLSPTDELIISDDGSTDETIQLVASYKQRYPQIIITEGEKRGSARNFASAVPKCIGDLILFSDQDDIWYPNKIDVMRSFFLDNKDILLAMHNADYCDANGKKKDGDIFRRRHPMRGYYSNLLHSSYYGCCMGAKKDFLMRYCSFIDDNTPFDQFFGLMAEKEKKTAFINSVLITHRYHGFNQSKKLNIFQQIIFRYRLFLVTQRASRNN